MRSQYWSCLNATMCPEKSIPKIFQRQRNTGEKDGMPCPMNRHVSKTLKKTKVEGSWTQGRRGPYTAKTTKILPRGDQEGGEDANNLYLHHTTFRASVRPVRIGGLYYIGRTFVFYVAVRKRGGACAQTI